MVLEPRLYITTKLPNPHFPPEICVAVSILNFMATQDGLQDQMLGIVVAAEEPATEEKRVNLVIESAKAKSQLKDLEDKILQLLSSSTGNILDDEELIETLSSSKIMGTKIEEQVKQQEITAVQIAEVRQVYKHPGKVLSHPYPKPDSLTSEVSCTAVCRPLFHHRRPLHC